MECRTDNPCDRISTVPGSPASHRTAPAGFAALRGGIGRRDRGGIFGTAGAQTGVRVPDSDGGEVTPATRSRTGTTSRSAGSLNEGRGRDPRRHVTKSGSVASFEKRSTKAGVETPATPRRQVARLARRLRSTKAGVETPATLLIGAKNLHGRNSAPDLAAHGRDVDHLFGPCLGVDVVAGPEMPSKSWTSHNLEPAGG